MLRVDPATKRQLADPQVSLLGISHRGMNEARTQLQVGQASAGRWHMDASWPAPTIRPMSDGDVGRIPSPLASGIYIQAEILTTVSWLKACQFPETVEFVMQV